MVKTSVQSPILILTTFICCKFAYTFVFMILISESVGFSTIIGVHRSMNWLYFFRCVTAIV
jgi:hypothetical protein